MWSVASKSVFFFETAVLPDRCSLALDLPPHFKHSETFYIAPFEGVLPDPTLARVPKNDAHSSDIQPIDLCRLCCRCRTLFFRRDTIGLRRASLKAETVKTLMFVKARLKLARKAVIDLVGDDNGDD
jgi:hypothetical protein